MRVMTLDSVVELAELGEVTRLLGENTTLEFTRLASADAWDRRPASFHRDTLDDYERIHAGELGRKHVDNEAFYDAVHVAINLIRRAFNAGGYGRRSESFDVTRFTGDVLSQFLALHEPAAGVGGWIQFRKDSAIQRRTAIRSTKPVTVFKVSGGGNSELVVDSGAGEVLIGPR